MRALLLVAISMGLLAGQTIQRVQIQRIASRPSNGDSAGLLGPILRGVQQAQWKTAETDEMRAVVAAAEKVAAGYIVTPLAAARGVATETVDGLDILLAAWPAPDGDADLRGVYLWDSPIETSYVFRCQPDTVRDIARLQSLVARLMRWGERDDQGHKWPVPVVSAHLRIWPDADAHRTHFEGYFQLGRPPFQSGGGAYVDIRGEGDASDGWVVVAFGKRLIGGSYPPEMYWVAERFPPLRQRVKEWTPRRLVSALEISSPILQWFRGTRDAILLDEWLLRQPESDEIESLLRRGATDKSLPKPHSVVHVMAVTGRASSEEKMLRRFLAWLGASPQTDTVDLALQSEFGLALRGLQDVPAFDLSDLALDYVRRGGTPSLTLYYVSKRATSIERWRELRELRLASRWGQIYLEHSLKRIRRTLGIDEDGNPVALRAVGAWYPEPDQLSSRLGFDIHLYKVSFPANSDKISRDELYYLEKGIEGLRKAVDAESPGFALVLEGHASDEDRTDNALDLSRRRAESVAEYLRNHGISADRLVITAHGARPRICVDRPGCAYWGSEVVFSYVMREPTR